MLFRLYICSAGRDRRYSSSHADIHVSQLANQEYDSRDLHTVDIATSILSSDLYELRKDEALRNLSRFLGSLLRKKLRSYCVCDSPLLWVRA